MTSNKKGHTPVPREAPPAQTQPKVKSSPEPAKPDTSAEDPSIKPEEKPEISPYYFPPPGEGLFPEIF